jgi:hypothetical protein
MLNQPQRNCTFMNSASGLACDCMNVILALQEVTTWPASYTLRHLKVDSNKTRRGSGRRQ